MPWKVRPTPDVLKADGSGTRRRTVKVGEGSMTLTFGKEPLYLDSLPPEIEQDAHLQVKEVTAQEVLASGGTVIELKPERVQEPEAVASTKTKSVAAAASQKPRGKPQAAKAQV
jgi:hypothetical protein